MVTKDLSRIKSSTSFHGYGEELIRLVSALWSVQKSRLIMLNIARALRYVLHADSLHVHMLCKYIVTCTYNVYMYIV